MKNLLLYLIIIYSCISCTKEKVATPPRTLTESPTPEAFIEPSWEASCVPFIPISIDTSAKWLDRLENPYRGRQEYGWARAEIASVNYEWNASARAFYSSDNNNIAVAMQTFRSEEDYYAFVERIYFRISKNTNRCTKLLKYNSNYPDTHFSTADYHIGDWDVIFYDYLPDENYQNTLEITTLDTINNLVQGRFDLKIIKTIPSFYEEIPDTIHFVNGVFECEILD